MKDGATNCPCPRTGAGKLQPACPAAAPAKKSMMALCKRKKKETQKRNTVPSSATGKQKTKIIGSEREKREMQRATKRKREIERDTAREISQRARERERDLRADHGLHDGAPPQR